MTAGSNRPRSALTDGAERMAMLARTVGERQLAERIALRTPETGVYSTSPDEAWSRKFMSQGIGPVPDCAAPGGFCPLPFAATAPSEPVLIVAQVPTSDEPEPARSVAFSQIGQAIGKPPKRSWFRRAP